MNKCMETIPLVVLSCDKYSDLWDGFFHQLNQNFPYPKEIYLVTNEKDYASPLFQDLKIIKTGKDIDWSTSLAKAIDQIPHKIFFLILEDIFISELVNETDYREVIEFAFRSNVQHLKYFASPKPNTSINPKIGRYDPGMPYSVTVCGIWNRSYLRSLIIPGESPWHFELNGSYRAKYSAERFYGLRENLFSYKNMVEKGLWIAGSRDWAIRLGIPIRVDARQSVAQGIFQSKKIYFDLIQRISWRARLRVIEFIKRMLISY